MLIFSTKLAIRAEWVLLESVGEREERKGEGGRVEK
jgi:hypothetical protein